MGWRTPPAHGGCWNILKVAARVEAFTEANYGTVNVEDKRSWVKLGCVLACCIFLTRRSVSQKRYNARRLHLSRVAGQGRRSAEFDPKSYMGGFVKMALDKLPYENVALKVYYPYGNPVFPQ